MSNNLYENLVCPVLSNWLENPIALSCRGGHLISKEACINLFNTGYKMCPVCRQNLLNFNPNSAPILLSIVSLIEELKAKNTPLPEVKPLPVLEWKAKLNYLTFEVYETVIGRLEFTTSTENSNFKTLLIPVVDESGSMGGNPTKQVKYSLNRIIDLTYKHKQIETHIISYDDRAKSFAVDKRLPMDIHREQIEEIGRFGGTSFRSAFDEIFKVIGEYKTDQSISSIIIIFLTDGEDSSVRKDKRGELVTSLKEDISGDWSKNFTVHSIGFGANHDYDFLNNLRQIGTTEGAYRYADPQEDSDSLSNKINSLLDVIANSSCVPLELISSPIPIINGSNDSKYWVDLTGLNLDSQFEFTISVNKEEPIKVITNAERYELQSPTPENIQNERREAPSLISEWYTYLVDEIASELLILNSSTESSVIKDLHLELLYQRSNAILVNLSSENPNISRLEKLMENINILHKGGSVNQSKLNDMKFEGKFATVASATQKITNASSSYQNTPSNKIEVIKPWPIIEKPKFKRCFANKNENKTFQVIGNYKSEDACKWFADQTDQWQNVSDNNGSNALIVASSIGKCKIVKVILTKSLYNFDINAKNNLGYNALDMTILYGWWKTFDLLVTAGCKPSLNGNLLLRTCLSSEYYEVASRLLKNNFSFIDDEMLENSPNPEVLDWLSIHSQKEVSIETAIKKGAFDILKEKDLSKFGKSNDLISWTPYLEIFANPNAGHLQIVEFLLSQGKANPMELINIPKEVN